MNDYVPMARIAASLGCSRATVYRLVQAGKLTPAYRPSRPRSPLFSMAQAEALLDPVPREPAVNRTLHRDVRRRDGQRCVVCFDDYRLSAHHVVPIERGGRDDASNLVALCSRCHTSVHGTGSSMKKRAKERGTLAVAEWLLAQVGANPVQR